MKESLMLSVEAFNDIENAIGYTFKNKGLLTQAFIHASYSNEHKGEYSYQLLEFIGDRSLDLTITEKICKHLGMTIGDRFIPVKSRITEGTLTFIKSLIVRKEALSSYMDKLGFSKYLFIGNGGENNNVRESTNVKEDLFESIIGAITLDCNWDRLVLNNSILKMIGNENIVEQIEKEMKMQERIEALSNWYFEHFKEEIDSHIFYDDLIRGDNTIESELTIESDNFSLYFEGVGYSFEETKRDVLIKAFDEIFIDKKMYSLFPSDVYKDCPKRVFECSIDTAVNVVQELEQAKKIKNVRYSFQQNDFESNGNPLWKCKALFDIDFYSTKCTFSCEINGCESKIIAKKYAALGIVDLYKEQCFNINK